MSLDNMLLMVMGGITLIAYMIAINSRGLGRLILSYLLATALLVCTVWGIVQHVNIGLDSVKTEELKKLAMEKRQAEDRVQSQEEALKSNKARMAFTVKLNAILTAGTAVSTSLANLDLQDKSADLDALVWRAIDAKKKVESLKQEFEKLSTADSFFNEPLTLIRDGLQSLAESGQYYQQYYYSEDSDQETLRERIMRQKARNAGEKFQKAGLLIASSG